MLSFLSLITIDEVEKPKPFVSPLSELTFYVYKKDEWEDIPYEGMNDL